ncbi:MAG: hypothetical protein ACKVP5_08455 [Aestuariivirga sp.]
MFPISDTELPFAAVAHEWAREMPQRPDEREVCTHLLHAVWAGALVVRKPTSGEPMLPRELLCVVFKTKTHPGFDISANGVPRSSSSEEQPDGGVVVGLHGHITLPEDSSQWTEQQMHDAIDVLGEQRFEDFTEPFRSGVIGLSVRRDDFADYCRSAGYPLPIFWFGSRMVKSSTAKAERDCAEWLRPLTKQPKQYPKVWYLDEAMRHFPRLSSRGFDRVWRKVTPKKWRAAGALGKRKAS